MRYTQGPIEELADHGIIGKAAALILGVWGLLIIAFWAILIIGLFL